MNAVFERHLRTRLLGRSVVFRERVDSTNLLAAQRAEAGAREGTIVVADAQSAGRGRRQRSWVSPPGRNLYVSLILRPAVPPVRVQELAAVLALGVRRGLLSFLPALPVRVKWPNDVWCRARKLAGILCQLAVYGGTVDHVVAGIGLNVNVRAAELPESVRPLATSLAMETGTDVDRGMVLAAVLNALEVLYLEWIDSADLGPFLQEWQDASVLAGRNIRVSDAGTVVMGRCLGMAPTGQLVLGTADGERRISSGDAHVLR